MTKIMVAATVRVEVDVDTWSTTYGTTPGAVTNADVAEHVPALVTDALADKLQHMGNGARLSDVTRVTVSRPY